LDENAPFGGLPAEDEEDESLWDEETKAKHALFKNKRHNHYGNEAEALKKAKLLLGKLLQDDTFNGYLRPGTDEEAVDDEDSDVPPPQRMSNGHS